MDAFTLGFLVGGVVATLCIVAGYCAAQPTFRWPHGDGYGRRYPDKFS